MARRNKETALQMELESQDEFDDALSKGGLLIIDVYQVWAGPCKPMTVLFKKIRNEIGDELLQFAIAKANTIECLQHYRGKCEPCFLFYAGGVLVRVVKGANCPLMNKCVLTELAQEHAVLDGKTERKELVDNNMKGSSNNTNSEENELNQDDEQEADVLHGEEKVMLDLPEVAQTQKKTITIAILTPDIVVSGKTEEVLERIQTLGIEILERKELTLTEELITQLYNIEKENESYNDTVEYLTGNSSLCLILTKGDTGEGIVEEWNDIIGPEATIDGQNADSLSTIYGNRGFFGSKSSEAATVELNLLFPDVVLPEISMNNDAEKAEDQSLSETNSDENKCKVEGTTDEQGNDENSECTAGKEAKEENSERTSDEQANDESTEDSSGNITESHDEKDVSENATEDEKQIESQEQPASSEDTTDNETGADISSTDVNESSAAQQNESDSTPDEIKGNSNEISSDNTDNS